MTLFKQQRNAFVMYTYIKNFPVSIFYIHTENSKIVLKLKIVENMSIFPKTINHIVFHKDCFKTVSISQQVSYLRKKQDPFDTYTAQKNEVSH